MHWMWIAASLVLAACGDDASTTPSTKNLRGYWSWEDDRTQTVFAFVPPEGRDLVYVQPELTLPGDKDISVVWLGTIVDRVLDDNQVATYEVKDDTLIQTVIGDVAAPPGTMYGTKILAFDDTSMTLESKNDPSGMRTYTKASRCQNQNRLGWQIATGNGVSAFARNSSIAIDTNGDVHALTGQGYVFQGEGCAFVTLDGAPMQRLTAIALRGEEVHTVVEGFDAGEVVHRWRTSPSAAWQTEMVAPPTTGGYLWNLALFVDGNDLVVVTSRSDGAFALYRKSGGAWQPVTVAPVIDHRVESVAMGPAGELVILGLDKIRRIRGTTVEEIALPRGQFDTTVNGGIAVDTQGRIHAAWTYSIFVGGGRSVYGVYDGAWTLHELGVAVYPRPVLGPNDEMRVLSSPAMAQWPTFTLTTIAPDGTQTSEWVTAEAPFGTAPDSSVRMAAVAGADGTIAMSWSGREVYVRHPERLRPERTMMFTAQITGNGRVYTDDGTLDCTATCTVPVKLGTRLRVKMTPGPGLKAYDSSCRGDPQVDGYCWHDILPGQMNLLATELTHSFFFMP